MTAPIALFVYSRLKHTRRTVELLKANRLASDSDLYIFSDGAKSEIDKEAVSAVRSYIASVTGFRSVRIELRFENYGLAKNIVDGVGRVCELHDKVIVVEDDIATSPVFLTYMNQALERYVDEKRIWHISGWSYPIDAEGMGDVFLWRAMNCWGWATWSNRWEYFSKDPSAIAESWNSEKIRRFNLNGEYNFWDQIILNKLGKLNTWAVFWYATIFENDGLCLNPTMSYVENTGFDGSGEHCTSGDIGQQNNLSLLECVEFPEVIQESPIALSRIVNYYRRQRVPVYLRVFRFLSRSLARFLR